MTTVDFRPHENLPTWAEANPQRAPNQQLQYGFALPSRRVRTRIIIQQQNANLKSLGRFFRIVPFNFDRVSQYLPRSIDVSNLQKVHAKVNASSVCKALNCSGKAF
ncbi:hypothetical protein TNCV_5018241 [Trichonephila clavipes]|nr:hypothetical protein TNCV_5018241 [Trichonephila clavipes]